MADNKNNSSDIILYSSPEGNIKVEVVYSGETFWLTKNEWQNCLVWKCQLLANTLQTSLNQANWFRRQLFPFWK